ncbi:hypothetical protein U472_08085 [Orenia metallireducens]|uniref:Uncharacterized protein n=1 Tax=Orenia metallireducens TaxID=1413210 RepID=A0A1C0A6V1_9FIRM|nr:tetratricopeptide repeat protein [Orenia metallireducens]OCL25977.1 hypothetical protein U472_08085 [Orenia metallireducens]
MKLNKWILAAVLLITLILIIRLVANRKKNNYPITKISDNKPKEYSIYQKNITYHGNYIDIDSIDFFGKFSRSPDNTYIVAYSESPINKYVLLKGEDILVEGDIERPSFANVANNGTFIINNWGISTNLFGLFTAFNKDGEIIVSEKLKANLYNNSISNDGSYAVCQTYKSKHEDDSNKLLFFDLKEKRLLWKIKPLTGIAESYSFDIDKKILTLHYTDNKSYRYNFEGVFLDEEILKENYMEIKYSTDLFEALEETHKKHLEDLSKEELNLHLKKLTFLLDFEDITTVKYKHARTYRYIGEVYLELNKKRDALENFKEALKISKRVGVKRITKQLEEELEVE